MNCKRKLFSFILNRQPAWWLEFDCIDALSTNAGFFLKRQVDLVDRFGKLTIDSAFDLDVLGSWQDNEKYLKERLQSCLLVELANLEPFLQRILGRDILKVKKSLWLTLLLKQLRNMANENYSLRTNLLCRNL